MSEEGAFALVRDMDAYHEVRIASTHLTHDIIHALIKETE